ncbi:unnamed protein product [marine sediment metagenome]|uniref:Uncharacterized protein n=1 Tax=marine sediment metagenome TaxID=412755 RepID=X1P9I3_9ZZZZ
MLIEIQERIVITQKDVDKIIKDYEKMSKKFSIGIGGWMGDRNDIIREIKKLSEVGKQILLMRYKFNKWKKEQENK